MTFTRLKYDRCGAISSHHNGKRTITTTADDEARGDGVGVGFRLTGTETD